MNQKQLSGLSAEELFERGVGITYADFTILDTIFTDINREDITLETKLGNGISLQTPIIASPMDTVTNAELCIAIALEGGIGCLHYNYQNPDGSFDIDEQIREITLKFLYGIDEVRRIGDRLYEPAEGRGAGKLLPMELMDANVYSTYMNLWGKHLIKASESPVSLKKIDVVFEKRMTKRESNCKWNVVI